MRVLVTGIAGFAGSFLADFLLQQQDVEIHGVIHRHDFRIQHLRDQVQLHRGDLRNALWVNELIDEVQPANIFHLAAWSDVGGSWTQPWTTYELNIHCQLNLLEALVRRAPASRVIVITSNEVYGLLHSDDIPVDEHAPFRPNSPYGVSKIAQDMMALQYWHSHGLETLRMRSFNHIGPGQSDDFVASAFARQIAEIEAGQRDPVVRVGNLDAVRDFTDVRDVVRSYWLAMEHGSGGDVYNVGSGQGHSVQWVLDTLLSLTPVDVDVELDSDRLRPSDVPISVCDSSKLTQATGWRPEIDLRHSLSDLLDGWRQQIAQQQTSTDGIGSPINASRQ